jgi:hypothetical protein
LSLYWRKVISLSLSLFLFFSVNAQKYGKNTNFLEYKNKDYYFGITLGFNTSKHFTLQSDEFIRNDSIQVIQGAQGLGFDVNGIVNFKIGDNFDIRSLPGFSFATRVLEFDPLGDNTSSNGDPISNLRKESLESILVKFPFHVRYKSAPFKDKRAFVVTGLNYSFDVASNSKVREELARNLIQVSPHDFQFEVGVGMQFFFPYFIFSPEFKFSQGLNNTLIYNQNLLESRVIEKLMSRTFTISFHIEG